MKRLIENRGTLPALYQTVSQDYCHCVQFSRSPVPMVEVEFQPHLEFSNLTDPISTRLWYDMRKQLLGKPVP